MCDYCKMPFGDNRLGAEIVTKTGKVYKFDDAHCIKSFMKSPDFKDEKGYGVYFVDFSGKHSLIPATTAFYLKSDALKSPMNGNIAAFSNSDSLQFAMETYPGTILTWNQVNTP